MDRKQIIETLKKEIDIEWLKVLNKFLKSYIDFLEIIGELEKEIKKEQG